MLGNFSVSSVLRGKYEETYRILSMGHEKFFGDLDINVAKEILTGAGVFSTYVTSPANAWLMLILKNSTQDSTFDAKLRDRDELQAF